MESLILPSKSRPPYPPAPRHETPVDLPPKSVKFSLSFIKPQSLTASLNVTDAHLNHLCKNGRLSQAVEALDDVAQCGFKLNSRTYIDLLQACIDSESIELGRKLHSRIGLVNDVDLYVETKLVGMYAKCGSFDDALDVFEKMRERNLYSWSAIIGACSREQRWREVVEIFGSMVREGVIPDAFLLPKILQACGNSGNLDMGKSIHSWVIRNGLIQSNTRVCNAVLGVYVKCGRLDLAEKLFKNMVERDRVAWNSMISGFCNCGNIEEANRFFHAMHDEGIKAGMVTWNILVASYCQSGKCDVAIELMKEMEKLGVRPDVFTWTSIISGFCHNNMGAQALELFKDMLWSGIEPSGVTISSALSACAKLKVLNKGKELHLYAVKMGVMRDVLVANSLIDMYSKCGDLEAARRIFDMVLKKDVYTWNSMIGGYIQAGYCGKAYDLFNKMQESDVKPNAVTWNVMISGYIQNGNEDQAMDLFEQMESFQIKRDTASWNTLISGYLQIGQTNKALGVFRKMHNLNVAPNAITILSVLPAFDNLLSLSKVKEIHCYAFRKNLASEIPIRNSLIDTYAKAGDIVYSKSIFNIMPQKDVISWNSLIGGYVLHGYPDLAIDLFNQLKKVGLKPNRGTFLNVIYACSKAKLVDEGKKIFASMSEDYQIIPSLEHYSAMVNLFGHSGRLREAMDFVERMPMEPDHVVLEALLTACRANSDYGLLVQTAERLLELEPGNSLVSNLLLQARIISGKSANTAKVRHLDKGAEINKPVGQCWIEAKNLVHSFGAGDWQRPCADLLYSLVETIQDRGMSSNPLGAMSIDEEEKEEICGVHSEKLAFAYALVGSPSVPRAIRIVKNIRMCGDCHRTAKLISRTYDVKIYLNDSKCFHRFENGKCSCGDYW
uniref:DYW domain-containing protein n=1 Tax=Kalanchoe fedtschenkoi TaxID=63787 RepID=A0A7N0U3E0_KALFE